MVEHQAKTQFGIDRKTGQIVIGPWRIALPRTKGMRMLIGVALVFGGILGFLPVLGFWMVPLGLIVLSHDLAFVRRLRRRLTLWWGRRNRKARRTPGPTAHQVSRKHEL